MALDNEVEPFVTEKGEGTFTLTEEAIKVGDLKLVSARMSDFSALESS
jgi:hypothetical protein